MVWTSPRTWVAGEKPSALTLNTHIRDNLKAVGDAWTAYTPTWSSSGAPSIGNGTITGAWCNPGKLVHFWAKVTAGTTTTFGTGGYTLTLPFTCVGHLLLPGYLIDDSASAFYPILGHRTSSGTAMSIRHLPTTAGNPTTATTSTAPVTLATADVLFISGTYERT